jgi:hypothetical protein
MVRIIIATALLCSSIYFVQAETVSLSGTVKKTGGSVGLAGVKVGLTKIKNLSTVTNADGSFSLVGSTSVLAPAQQNSPLQFTLKGKAIVFFPTFQAVTGSMEVFSSDGKRKALTRFVDLKSGNRSVAFPELNPGINIIHLKINGELYTRTLMRMGKDIILKNEFQNKNAGRFTLAKQSAAVMVDTLVAEKEGYETKKAGLENYNKQNISIVLDSIVQISGPCSRQVLQAAADSYINAQEAGDPSKMSLASHVRYIENLDTITMEKSICKKALPIAAHHDFLDCDSCRTFSEVIVTSGGHPYVIGMRLRIVDSKVAEVDAIVTDSGDWLFNAKNYLDTANAQKWDTLPLSQRTSRQILINAANAYGAIFEVPHKDTIPFGSPCSRLEGGTPAVCTAGFPTGSTNHKLSHRDFVVDVDKGVINMFCFLEVGGKIPPKPDSHLLRLISGKIRYVHTLTIWDL